MLEKTFLFRNEQILVHFKIQGLLQDNQDLSGTFPGPSGLYQENRDFSRTIGTIGTIFNFRSATHNNIHACGTREICARGFSSWSDNVISRIWTLFGPTSVSLLGYKRREVIAKAIYSPVEGSQG